MNAAACAAVAVPGLAQVAGEPWPTRPIHLIVAYPPGGVSDETARALAQHMSARLKVPVIVENRAGAGGLTALESLARAAPDGHTLAYCAISPLVFAPAGAGPLRDGARGGPRRQHHGHAGAGARASVVQAERLRRDARRPRARRRAACAGRRRATRRSGTWCWRRCAPAARVDIIHVPYKGGGQQLTDAIGGQFELLSSNVASQQLQFVRQGKLKALAIGSPVRLPVLPDVPTLAELGFPDANLVSTFGLFAPRGVPEERLRLINSVVNEALRLPEIRSKILDVSNLPTGGSAADFAARIAKERERALRVPAD
ncbi:Bug family tripartite tricarboxylate transporter substrate binding protein [Roseateles sp. UC29_93]|uniref:Bug family tripartite tricarboxylate transporter substrate binding protein n=1 Tax=Roseateles sp. UC29_93 TaxID=3350177 RepID=UPI00366EA963